MLVLRYAVEGTLGAHRLQSRLCLCGAAIRLLWLCLAVLSIGGGDVVRWHGSQTLGRDYQSHAGCVLR